MNRPSLTGKLVRLVAVDVERDARNFHRWSRDSEYGRLLDTDPARLFSIESVKAWLSELAEKEQPNTFLFAVETLQDSKIIGFVELEDPNWVHRDAWVGIGIGERDYWGKGYGSDAMQEILRYAFDVLNLERVTLTVFEYNPRAIRSYEKVGFAHEGRERQFIQREGRRYDLLYMGILREEWLRKQEEEK